MISDPRAEVGVAAPERLAVAVLQRGDGRDRRRKPVEVVGMQRQTPLVLLRRRGDDAQTAEALAGTHGHALPWRRVGHR
jgi:hypothetical protein